MIDKHKSKWTKQFAVVPVRLRNKKLVWLRWVYSRTTVAMQYLDPIIYKREYDLEENIITEILTK